MARRMFVAWGPIDQVDVLRKNRTCKYLIVRFLDCGGESSGNGKSLLAG